MSSSETELEAVAPKGEDRDGPTPATVAALPDKSASKVLRSERLAILRKEQGTQRLQNPLIKEYSLNYNRNPNKI